MGGWLEDRWNEVKETPIIGDVVKAAEKLAETSVAISIAPTKILVDAVSGKPIDVIAKNLQDVIVDHASATAMVSNIPNFVIIDTANALGGRDAANIAIAATAGQVIQNSFWADLLEQTRRPDLKISDLALVPLDTLLTVMLKSAEKQLRSQSKPIPDLVKIILEPKFEGGLIDRARYVVGGISLTLPQLVNGFQSFMGNHAHAVTIPGIIVFSSEPGQSKEDIRWWAHELQHVRQYEELGVAGFASKYIQNYAELEANADAKAASLFS